MSSRPPVLVTVAQEKRDSLMDLIGRGQVTRPISAVASWDEMQSKGPELLSAAQSVIHFPHYADMFFAQGSGYDVAPALARALEEHIAGPNSHIVLLPTEKYVIRKPFPRDLERIAIEEWNKNPAFGQQKLVGSTKAIVGALFRFQVFEWIATAIPQKA